MSDIFVSYASEDRERIQPLVYALEQAGWSVFWDRTIPAGKTWREVIGGEIHDTCCVLAVWTKKSVNKDWVQEEAEEGKRRGILIPVMLDAVEPPFGFGTIQAADLVSWKGDNSAPVFVHLLTDMADILGPPPGPDGEDATQLLDEDKQKYRKKIELGGKEHKWSRALISRPMLMTAVAIIVVAVGIYLIEPPTDHTSDDSIDYSPEIFSDNLRDGRAGPEMVKIPTGEFSMGDIWKTGAPDELPVHKVYIHKPFGIGLYETTFAEYDHFAEATGRPLPDDAGWGRGKRPVINVSWEDALAYADWLSTNTGKSYRLPSEAEWEYASRAGVASRYWWGDEAELSYANCDGCGSRWDGRQTASVGSLEPNPFGLYDIAGNVWEWVQDCWHKNFNGAPVDGRAWEEARDSECSVRVLRGGSWNYPTRFVRSSNRDWNWPDTRHNFIGFRLARDMD